MSVQFGGQEPVNYETKCACVLALDVSGSMSGAPLQQLNEGLQAFHRDVLNNQDPTTPNRLEVGLVTFSSTVQVIQDPSLVTGFTMPTLSAGGSTKLVDGVREAMRVAESRKEWYRQTGQDYYRPYVILITDGAPDGDQDVSGLAAEITAGVDGRRFVFWAFGTDGANMEMLKGISHASTPPLAFRNTDFKEFFRWLSKSFALITKSREGDKINLTPERPSLFQHTI